MGLDKDEKPRLEAQDDSIEVGEVINASGHKQELERQFSLLSICSIGITTGNVWAALGGSIVSTLSHWPYSQSYICDTVNMLMIQGRRTLQWRSTRCHLCLHCYIMFLFHDRGVHC